VWLGSQLLDQRDAHGASLLPQLQATGSGAAVLSPASEQLCHACIRRPAPVLCAYNAEADNLVRALKPYKLDSATERLNKIAGVISKLGKTMNIRISDAG
jgi:Domain of unknown function (DUF4041)